MQTRGRESRDSANGSELRETGQKTKNDSMKALNDIQDNMYEVANATGRKVRVALDSATDSIKDAGEVVGEQIRQHPVRSSVLALCGGVILGMLLRR